MLYIHRYKILSRTYEIVLCILSLSYDKLNKTVKRMKLEEIRKDNDITELKKTQVYDFYKNIPAQKTPTPFDRVHSLPRGLDFEVVICFDLEY